MKLISKTLAAVAVASAMAASFPAHAAYISFGGVAATQDDVDTLTPDSIRAGLTSGITGVKATGNYSTASNVFVETFDWVRYSFVLDKDNKPVIDPLTGQPKVVKDPNGTLNQYGLPGRPTSPDPNFSEITFTGEGAGFNSLNPNTTAKSGDLTLLSASSTSTTMGIRRGTLSGTAAAPGGDCTQGGAYCNDSYFAYGPGPSGKGSLPVSVNVSYANLLNQFGTGFGIDYLGIFYGSVDWYNEIRFYGADKTKTIKGVGLLSDGVLTGQEILDEFKLQTGNQTASNVYVNLGFDAADVFSSFEFYTSDVAFEMDNIVTRISNIPEPGSMALVGLGLMGLAGLRRRKQQA